MRPSAAATTRVLDAAGGLDAASGLARDPRRLWDTLAGGQSILVYASDRKTLVGEVRILPDGAGLYRDGDAFFLLSPEELEDLARRRLLGL